jgi:hypothetical protein
MFTQPVGVFVYQTVIGKNQLAVLSFSKLANNPQPMQIIKHTGGKNGN